jgi:predicted lipoprotein with Yx(FWY)xxD motif
VNRAADPRRRARWSVAALATLALSGCASPPPPSSDPASVVAEAAASAQAEAAAEGAAGGTDGGGGRHAPSKVELWAVQSGPLGIVVTDGDGLPIYRNDHDGSKPPTSTCTGDCTKLWPPVLVGSQPPDLDGIDAVLVGTLQRPDGQRQLTLAGWPLYRHAGDDGALRSTYANGDDNAWFAISPSGGHAVTAR